MIKGVVDVYYNVSDMGKSVEFYTTVLNMEKKFGDEHWTELSADGLSIGLHWSEGKDIPEIPRDSHGAYAGATLTLRSDNLDEDRKILESKGIKILGQADQPWGEMLVFEDFDKNVLKLMNPKC